MEGSRREAGSLVRGHCWVPGRKDGGGAQSAGSRSGDERTDGCFVGAENRGAGAASTHKPRRQSQCPASVSRLRPGQLRVSGARAGVCNTQPGTTSLHPGPSPPAQCHLQTLPERKGKTLDLAQSRQLSILGRGHWSREKCTDSGPLEERKSGTSPLNCGSQMGKGCGGRHQVSRHVHPVGR